MLLALSKSVGSVEQFDTVLLEWCLTNTFLTVVSFQCLIIFIYLKSTLKDAGVKL